MKTYAIASLTGALAFTVIVVGARPCPGPAIAQAWVGASPAAYPPMARRDSGPWLLRAMNIPGAARTLTALPGDPPAPARSL